MTFPGDKLVSSKYKDRYGRWRTQSLFYETYSDDKSIALYTMGDEDKVVGDKVLPSFKRLYLLISDPTEYKVAINLVGGLKHWETLCATNWFKAYIDPIRYELEIKLRSDCLAIIYSDALAGSKSALQAAKYFASGEYLGLKKGRPSKRELQEEKSKRLEVQEKLQEDAERLGLSIVKDTSNG